MGLDETVSHHVPSIEEFDWEQNAYVHKAPSPCEGFKVWLVSPTDRLIIPHLLRPLYISTF